MIAKAGFSEMTVSAVVIRADGTREDLGVICHTKKSPEKKSMFSRFLKTIRGNNNG